MRNLFAAPEEQPAKKGNGKDEGKERAEDRNTGKQTSVFRSLSRNFERRVKSELFLEDSLPWHFKPGEAYHCFSFGDVDALTYLRAVLKQEPLEYVCLSTFSMALTDAELLLKWQRRGLIGRLDLYLGEIFDSKFVEVYNTLCEAVSLMGGRVAVFRNHSKVMAGFGDSFDFAVEGSANLNSNPRCEQTVITVDSGVARFYKEEVFDKIHSFNNDFPDWKPYTLKRNETF